MLFLIVIIDFWIRGSTQLHWKLASRKLSSEGVLVEQCELTTNCSKLVIHNLKYTDTGYYTCSHNNSRKHKSSTYVFVKGELLVLDTVGHLTFSWNTLETKEDIIGIIIISRIRNCSEPPETSLLLL